MSHLRSFQWCRKLPSASRHGVQKAPRAGLKGRELRLAFMPSAQNIRQCLLYSSFYLTVDRNAVRRYQSAFHCRFGVVQDSRDSEATTTVLCCVRRRLCQSSAYIFHERSTKRNKGDSRARHRVVRARFIYVTDSDATSNEMHVCHATYNSMCRCGGYARPQNLPDAF